MTSRYSSSSSAASRYVLPVGDDQHLRAAPLGQERVGVIVGGQVVVRPVGERDLRLERAAGAGEVRVEARQPLARLQAQLGQVDERAVAEQRELDVLGARSPVFVTSSITS